jgi:hypothetical protein
MDRAEEAKKEAAQQRLAERLQQQRRKLAERHPCTKTKGCTNVAAVRRDGSGYKTKCELHLRADNKRKRPTTFKSNGKKRKRARVSDIDLAVALFAYDSDLYETAMDILEDKMAQKDPEAIQAAKEMAQEAGKEAMEIHLLKKQTKDKRYPMCQIRAMRQLGLTPQLILEIAKTLTPEEAISVRRHVAWAIQKTAKE